MKYIAINKEIETPSGFVTDECIVRISSFNSSGSITQATDVVTYSVNCQISAYKSLVDFEANHSPISVNGMPMSFNYVENLSIDELYTKVEASLVAAGFPCTVEETV
jgi:hypothetical protein